MTRFCEPDLTVDANSPFVRDASNKLVRRAYWMDMTDPTFSDGHDERDRCKSDQRRKEGASNRSEAGTLDRSGMRSGNFAA